MLHCWKKDSWAEMFLFSWMFLVVLGFHWARSQKYTYEIVLISYPKLWMFQMRWMRPTTMSQPPGWCSKQTQTLLHLGKTSTQPSPPSGTKMFRASFSWNIICELFVQFYMKLRYRLIDQHWIIPFIIQEQSVLHCMREPLVRTLYARGKVAFKLLSSVYLLCSIITRQWVWE